MFLKPFRIKTQTAIKGSDRKKLRTEIGKQFSVLSQEDINLLIPLKDEMTMMKIFTHGGQTVTVYNVHKNPVFFEADRQLYPTIYALWTYPEILPVFTTWPLVLKKIAGGADLMLPGVVIKGEITLKSLGNYEKGTLCSVKLLGNKCPVAVGNTALSSYDMYMSAMRGKGVTIIHSYQDHLWAHGDKTMLPTIVDTEMLGAVGKDALSDDSDDDDSERNKSGAEDSGLEENDSEVDAVAMAGPSINNCDGNDLGAASSSADNVDNVVKEETDSEEEGGGDAAEDAASDQVDPQYEMDQLFLQCFICALNTRLKQTELPVLTSKFFKSHMQPCCPPSKSLDVKKSSYKKLSKFLQEMKNRGYLEIKEHPKGVENITKFDKNHPDIREFEFSITLDEDELSAPVEQEGFRPPSITEVLVVTANVLPLFGHKGFSKGSVTTGPEARKVVIEYIKENNLLTDTPGIVVVDPHLGDLVLNKGENMDRMKYETVVARCLAKLTPAHRILRPGYEPEIKKGKLEPITFNVVTRAGNKKVTLVDNLDVYGIDLEEFSHAVQKGVASSASIQTSATKGKGPQVLVQGNQINYIAKLLIEKYHIQKKWLTGLDKAPKPGKKKK